MDNFSSQVPIHEAMVDVHGLIRLQFELGIGTDAAFPVLIGNPGIAKTALCKEYFSTNYNLIITDFPHLPLEEVGGMPIISDFKFQDNTFKKTDWTIPSILAEIFEAIEKKPTVLFFDEVDKCDQAHQDLLVSILNGKLRGMQLPTKNFAIILAGNGSHRAGSKVLSSILTNRCAMFPVHMDFEFWKKSFALPNNVNPKVVSFLSNNTNRKFFSMEEMVNRPWASPRAWTRFATFLTLKEKYYKKLPAHQILSLSESFVGREASSEFSVYYSLYSEVEMDKVFEKKKEIEIPNNYSQQYVYILSAVYEFFNVLYNDSAEQAFSVMANIIVKIAKASSELALVGMREILENDSNNSKKKKKKSCFLELRTRIKAIDETVYTRISEDLEMIS